MHLLEPMSELKETIKAKPILKQLTKDKVISEITTGASKNVLKAIMDNPKFAAGNKRRSEANKSSNSVDLNPLSKPSSKISINKDPLKKDDVLAKDPKLLSSPTPKPKKELPPPPRVELGVILKVEVAKRPADQRPTALEAAYTLEEML
jgi:hypothetical protein